MELFLAGIALCLWTICTSAWADESKAASLEGNGQAAQSTPPAPRPHVRQPHSAAQVLEEHVKALTRQLDLDPKQQAGVREILVRERVAMLDLRKSATEGKPAQDFVAASQAIVMRTRGEIRNLLNGEQRKKFFVDVPQDNLAPAQADRDYWLERTRPKAAVPSTSPASN